MQAESGRYDLNAVDASVLTALLIVLIVSFRVLVNAYNELPAPHDNAWMAWLTLGGIGIGPGAAVSSRERSKVLCWRRSDRGRVPCIPNPSRGGAGGLFARRPAR